VKAYTFLLFLVILALVAAFIYFYSKRNIIQNKKHPNQQSLDQYFIVEKKTIDNTNTKKRSENSLNNTAKTDLKYLKNVSQDQMNKIISEKIYSIKDLREKIKTKKEIDEFSEKIGVYRRIINEWIILGEFSKLTGINQEYINLFSEVNINTLNDLSEYEPEDLYELLKKENINNIPTIGMLSHWIRISKKVSEDRINLLIDN
jgi:hypothetical protein